MRQRCASGIAFARDPGAREQRTQLGAREIAPPAERAFEQGRCRGSASCLQLPAGGSSARCRCTRGAVSSSIQRMSSGRDEVPRRPHHVRAEDPAGVECCSMSASVVSPAAGGRAPTWRGCTPAPARRPATRRDPRAGDGLFV